MPTRDEIVKALRHISNDKNMEKTYGGGAIQKKDALCKAADLIEQQARQIKQLTESLLLANVNFEHAKRERDAAIADIEKLMSEVGLKCWEACEFCGMHDDDECIRNQPKGKCKAKWRGVGCKSNVD